MSFTRSSTGVDPEATMPESLACCRTITDAVVANPALRRMAVFDWYDGPASALLICDACAAVYAFTLTDWSGDHATPVFGLRRMPNGTVGEVSTLLHETPQWPMWFPAKLKAPADTDRVLIDTLDAQLAAAAVPSLVVGWSVPLAAPLGARGVPPPLTRHVVDLLAPEDGRSEFDWLGYLGLNR